MAAVAWDDATAAPGLRVFRGRSSVVARIRFRRSGAMLAGMKTSLAFVPGRPGSSSRQPGTGNSVGRDIRPVTLRSMRDCGGRLTSNFR
jgi:hypothetical protein